MKGIKTQQISLLSTLMHNCLSSAQARTQKHLRMVNKTICLLLRKVLKLSRLKRRWNTLILQMVKMTLR